MTGDRTGEMDNQPTDCSDYLNHRVYLPAVAFAYFSKMRDVRTYRHTRYIISHSLTTEAKYVSTRYQRPKAFNHLSHLLLGIACDDKHTSEVAEFPRRLEAPLVLEAANVWFLSFLPAARTAADHSQKLSASSTPGGVQVPYPTPAQRLKADGLFRNTAAGHMP